MYDNIGKIIMRDEVLEKYLDRLKNSKNSDIKLSNSKKAKNRIKKLKINYKLLCENLTNDAEFKNEILNINDIISELKQIDETIDSIQNLDEINELVNKFVRYKWLLKNFNINLEKVENEISRVDNINNEIVIQKLDWNDIL